MTGVPKLQGVSLGEALRYVATEAELAELDKYSQYRELVLDVIAAMAYQSTPEMELALKYFRLREPLEARVLQKLRSEEWQAWGLEMPLRIASRPHPIAPELWNFLEPNFDEASASGKGLEMVDIRVSIALKISDAESFVDNPPCSPIPSISGERIQLLVNGGVLVVNGEKLYFKGPAQQRVLSQLYEAYEARKILMTREVLRNANTEVDTFAKLFAGRYWKKLRSILQQENGFCWLEIRSPT
jgi:hypothetical protein